MGLIYGTIKGMCDPGFSFWKQFFESSSAVCFFLSSDFDVVMASKGGREFLGQRFSDWSSFSFPALFGEQAEIILSAVFHQVLESADIFDQEMELCDSCKKPVRMNVYISRFTDEKANFLFVRLHSKEDQVHLEQALLEAREEAYRANRIKSDFLANLSHEVRTPLNSIMGFSQVLEREISDPVLKTYVNSITTSGKALLSLINDILDLSRMESGTLKLLPQPMDIRVLAQSVESMFAFQIISKKLQYHLIVDSSLPQHLFIDEIRLRQILLNLMGNAVKFTGEGSVSLEFLVLRKSSASLDLRICVRDTGRGIREEDRQFIFDAFHKGGVEFSASQEGRGLGLAVTSKLVQLMKGKIFFESDARGTAFFVDLFGVEIAEEFAEVVVKQEVGNDPSLIGFQPATILIVDDVQLNRDLLKSFLNFEELNLVEAVCGKQAITLARSLKPDLILMDIKMPGMDGYQATEILKNDPDCRHIPVVAVTASVIEENLKMQAKYFDGFLFKPINYPDLILVISDFLVRKDRQSEREIILPFQDSPVLTNEDVKLLWTVEPLLVSDWLMELNEFSSCFHFTQMKELSGVVLQTARKLEIKTLEEWVIVFDKMLESYDIEQISLWMKKLEKALKASE